VLHSVTVQRSLHRSVVLHSDQVHMFRFRYVLHPWTAKYSHRMWHCAIALSVNEVDAIALPNGLISHLEYSVVSLMAVANILANGA
jgi:hypothetical protein